MELTVKDERKLVEIWLTNAEKSDPVLRAGLQSVYDTYKKKKYLVAVFESGNCDLYEQTRDLLLITDSGWRSRKSSVKRRSR